jgi:hypothetical protein
MTKLPMPQLEAEALTFARNHVAKWHRAGVATEDQSQAFLRDFLRLGLSLSAVARMKVIALARSGDAAAQTALRERIIEMQSRGQVLPVELQNYNMEVLHGGMGHARRGPKKVRKFLRNVGIALTVAGVQDRFGLDPLGHARHRRSACDIVAEALREAGISMGTKSVEAIWTAHRGGMPDVPGWTMAD